ncbi:hypothetical protein RUM43_005698 [Polyplax serrata]|uniref:DUF1907 domain-containing protein n=1 Tax=Polyplax serrata TaxID=468196 RepID=A0AAN8PXE6_POLSC
MIGDTVKIDNSMVESFSLSSVPLEELADLLNERLKSNFEDVDVTVSDCPDLSEAPFTLACKGLTGKAVIVDVGGVPYLLPRPLREKLYDLRDIGKLLNLDPCYITGAGAGPWPYAGTNCEMMINLKLDGDTVENKTRIAKVDTTNGKCLQEILPNNECRHAVLSNLYCSLGQEGKVLKISCAKRIGKDDFVASIRKILADKFNNKYIGLGGVFLIQKGKVKQHVMPDFSKQDINSEADLNNWLKFYEMDAPLIAVGTLINRDPGLDLRLQHFHSFSHHGEGGHYHIDTTPNDVEYLAYFGLAEKLYRIDKPAVTHTYGRN